MLKINSKTSTSQNNTELTLVDDIVQMPHPDTNHHDDCSSQLIENTVIVESDNPDITVDTTVLQEDKEHVFVTTIVTDPCNQSEVHLNTAITYINRSVNCAQIIAKNSSSSNVKWVLISSCGQVLYTSPTCGRGRTSSIKLPSICMCPHTKFKLKAVGTSKETISSTTLEYDPHSKDAANFELKEAGTKTTLFYLGLSSI